MIAAADVDDLSIRRDFGTEAWNALPQIVDLLKHHRTPEPERLDDEVVDRPGERPVRRPLQGLDEKHVPDVRVGKTLAWWKEQARRQHGFEKLLTRPGLARTRADRVVILRQRAVVAQATRMPNQVRQRDRGGNIYVRQPAANRIGKLKGSDLRQTQDADS